MNEEVKEVLGEAFDCIADMIEFIRDDKNLRTEKKRELLNNARNVNDSINDEIYKTL
tara:strand:- start:1421 stop:1591 length:171 start_codon:yes stop_codon:yes gene_type:complete